MTSSIHMPHRLLLLLDQHYADSLVAMLTTLLATTFSAAMLAADTGLSAETTEIRLLLMPLIGALVGTTGMVLLAPMREDRRRVAGRAILAVAFGAGAPVVIGITSSYGRLMAGHPVALWLVGLIVAMIIFALARAVAERLFARADDLAERIVDAGEQATHLQSARRSERRADPEP